MSLVSKMLAVRGSNPLKLNPSGDFGKAFASELAAGYFNLELLGIINVEVVPVCGIKA